MPPLGHRAAWILLLGTLSLVLAPVLFEGEVIASHDNRRAVGLDPIPDPSRISNPFKFEDHVNWFVPELQQHLDESESSWLRLWTPNVELGRPSNHAGVWSKAYPLTHLLSWAFGDAYRAYTWLAVFSLFLLGIFAQLYLRVLGLAPAACLVGSIGLCAGVFAFHWLTFVTYLSVPLWTLALLWAVTRYLRSPGLALWMAIAFFVYCLLLSGYPQLVVYSGYLLAGSTLVVAWERARTLRGAIRRAAGPATASLAGLAAASPVYLDLALNWARSARAHVGESFLLATSPAVTSLSALSEQLELLFDAFWLGNPVLPSFPTLFHGLSLTPLVAMLLPLGFRAPNLWWWQLMLVGCLVCTWWEPAYRFGFEHLGMGISRIPPLAGAYVPALVLAAHGADRVLRQPQRGRGSRALLCVSPLGLALLAAWLGPHPTDRANLAIGLALAGATLLFVVTARPWLLAAIVVGGALHHAGSQVLARPFDRLAGTSPLVEGIGLATRDGSRFAWVDGWIISPNQEIRLNLRSVHSRNSIPSALYHSWTRRLSPRGAGDAGRVFDFLGSSARLDPAELSLAGVGLLLSHKPLDPALAKRVGKLRGLVYYQPVSPPILAAVLDRFRPVRGGFDIEAADALEGRARARRRGDRGGRLLFEVEPATRTTLLFVSQQFHPQWRAFAGERALQTVLVDGFYQGVVLPAQTAEVRLEFLPYARLAWIPQLAFPAAAVAAFGWDRRRRRSARLRDGPST